MLSYPYEHTRRAAGPGKERGFMERFLNELVERTRPRTGEGRAAAYIPELKKQDPSLLGVDLLRPDGSHLSAGDWDVPFTIQSIIKPVILLLALMDNGIAGVRRCIGVEATGRPFDAINLSGETLSPQHFNPMVNMGAILLCTQLRGRDYGERFDRLLALTRKLAGSDAIAVDEAVYRSEKATGSKNRALCYLLKANGLISDPAEAVLDCYFRACSIRVTCRDLSRIAMVLASHGRSCPGTGGAPLFPEEYGRFVNAILTTCGMYDGSGDFAVRVGVPAKSGVGGGILAVAPGRLGIGIFGPALDERGNSVAGTALLEELSARLGLSIF